MRIRIIWPGKTKDPNVTKLTANYSSRISHFLPIEIVEARKDPLRFLTDSDFAIMLDSSGKSWTSDQFANFVRRHMTQNPKNLTFVIGDHAGLSPEAKKRADLLWSLSPLTFTHDMTRVVVLEQIYRALTMIHNFPYSR